MFWIISINNFTDMLKSDRPVYYTRGSTVVKRLGVSKVTFKVINPDITSVFK